MVSTNRLQRALVTIYEPEPQHPLLKVEDFDDLTESIVCKDDQMIVKFKTKEAVGYVAQKWGGAIEGGKSFYMITHPDHKTCHAETKSMQRTAFEIKALKKDDSTSTVTLTKIATPWEKVAKNMDLTLESLEKPAKRIKRASNRRGPAERRYRNYESQTGRLKREIEVREEGDASDDLTMFDGLKQSIAKLFPEALLVPLSAGSPDPSNRIRIITGENFKEGAEFFVADCVGCYAEGNIMLNTTAQVRNGARVVTNVNMGTKVKGKLGIELTVRGFAQYDFNIINTFFKTAVPFSSIPGIAEIDPTFLPGPGFKIMGSFDGKVYFGFDFDIDIQQSVKVLGTGDDSQKPDKPISNKMDIKPFADVTLVANGTFEPYFRIGVGLGVSVLDEKVSAGLFAGYRLITPMTVGMKATTTDVGVCEGTGKLSAHVETKIAFQDGWKLGVKVEAGKFIEVLYNFFCLGYYESWNTIKELPILSKCVSIGDKVDEIKKFIDGKLKEGSGKPDGQKPNTKPKPKAGSMPRLPAYMRLG
ncbi:hypothetical protein Dda_8330 [Drechslerella dactyloides]|uniref:DUF7029 domain-containing protein n=1 Tax=Drechslerella dactyloides TaxID=74499 RepID=A0AAD6IQD1_DREDA|nr:hypothetical protein Dda_8330 [Drechslerella dactyloides]